MPWVAVISEMTVLKRGTGGNPKTLVDLVLCVTSNCHQEASSNVSFKKGNQEEMQ